MTSEGNGREMWARRKAVGKPSEDQGDCCYKTVQEFYEVPFMARLFEDYVEVRAVVLVHLGWRFGEGPRVDVVAGLYRAKDRGKVESRAWMKPRRYGDALHARYDMQLSVLVDVVKGVEVVERSPHAAPLVVTQHIWLKKADGPLVALAQRLDASLTFFAEPRTVIEDRELAGTLDGSRDAAAVVAGVKLPYELIQGAAQVEHDLARNECPRGLNARELSQVEAVFKATAVLFGLRGPRLIWMPPTLDFVLDDRELRLCSGQLRGWAFDAPRHSLPSGRMALLSWRSPVMVNR